MSVFSCWLLLIVLQEQLRASNKALEVRWKCLTTATMAEATGSCRQRGHRTRAWSNIRNASIRTRLGRYSNVCKPFALCWLWIYIHTKTIYDLSRRALILNQERACIHLPNYLYCIGWFLSVSSYDCLPVPFSAPICTLLPFFSKQINWKHDLHVWNCTYVQCWLFGSSYPKKYYVLVFAAETQNTLASTKFTYLPLRIAAEETDGASRVVGAPNASRNLAKSHTSSNWAHLVAS